MISRSVQSFATRGHINCAQKVYLHFKDRLNLTDEDIDSMKIYGGGKAPLGRCGALHSVLTLVKDPVKREMLEKEFADQASSSNCLEIRRARNLSCPQCVVAACELGDKYVD